MTSFKEKQTLFIKILSTALCAALIVAAPGPFAVQAAATVIRAKAAPVSSIPGNAGAAAIGGINTSSALQNLKLSNSLSQGLPGLPSVGGETITSGHAKTVTVAPSHVAVVEGPVKTKLKNTVSAPAADTAGRSAQAKPAVKSTLQDGVQKIDQAAGTTGRFSALKSLFSGARSRKGSGDFVHAADQAAADSGLSQLTIGDLEAIAVDSAKPQDERRSAVKAIIKQGGAETQAALSRIADANPKGGAADYEIHRTALKALAEDFGELRSLRPITRAHADAILQKLEKDKPEEAFFDYDDTLAPFNTPISPETGEALKAAADAGVEPIILTDRPDAKKREQDVTIVDSLTPLTLAQKQSLTLVSSRGTRTLLYNRKGEPVLVREETGSAVHWTEAEQAGILQARQAFLDHYGYHKDGSAKGEQAVNGKTYDLKSYSYAHFLPLGWSEQAVRDAAEKLQEELFARNVPFTVTPRIARNPEVDAPYMTVSKIDKRTGVLPLRANRRAIEQVKDMLRFGLPARFAKAAWKAVNMLVKRPVGLSKTLSVGDQFFDMRTADMGFVYASPGALAISVGGKADPRLENVVVWPTEGAEASREILQALGKQAPSEMNKKAVIGLFAQRTASIAAFILTSIAYPFLVVGAFGGATNPAAWATYGLLMSFGPLAAIAAGPLNGLIADRLSARNGMALNTVIRVLSSLLLPVLAMFGYLNFGTLLIGSFVNGWLLSSIMTTENSYIKRLAGAKNVFMVGNLAWMNYLAIQVVLGLILGIGTIVDQWNPMTAFWINAIVNAVIVLPILWFTMPTLSPQPKTIQKMEARRKKLQDAKGSDRAEIEEIKKSISDREGFLNKSIADNEAVIAEAKSDLAQLEAQTPKGLRARWNRWAEMKSLQADVDLREKTILGFKAELAREVLTFKDRLLKLAKFLRRNWLPSTLLAAGIGGYFLFNSTLPIIGSLLFWITTTTGFKVMWYGKGSDVTAREKELADKIAAAKKAGAAPKASWKTELSRWKSRLPKALLMLSLIAMMMYPFQYLALPKIAVLLVGAEGKALLMGQLLGALFFGNLISNAAQAKLGEVKIPLIGRVALHRIIQAVVVGLGMTWVYTGLFAGSLIAALIAGAVIGGMIAMASKLTKRAWLKFVGVGFAGVWIPYLVWGLGMFPFIPATTAMMLAVLGIGMAFGPAYTTLMGYFFSNAARDKSGSMGGVQSSFFNAAVAGGYGILALATSLMNPAFPAFLGVLGVFYLLAGLLFFAAPKRLPGLPETLLEPKQKK
ncbi:MAG: MFS transporter [Elusimicrobiota bacterium]